MPRANRTGDVDYTIILIHNPKENIKLLDLTTSKNFRNYKWAIENAIKHGTKKTNKIVNKIRDYEPKDFMYEKLDFYYGRYSDAVKKMNEIAYKLGIESNYSVSNNVMELREELAKE